MSWLLKSVYFLALAAFMMSGSAEQPSTADKPVAEKKETVESRTTEATTVKPDRQKIEPAGRFNPSEKLRADDAVSFPVDI